MSSAHTADPPTGVCLLYMGGPSTVDQVRPFLMELFADRDLIRLPGGPMLQGPLSRLIVSWRAPRSEQYYREIGGGSPLLEITARQASLLERALVGHGEFLVRPAMRYCAPRAVDALDALQAKGVRRCVALPLYPHYSASTTGSSFKDLDRALAGLEQDIEVIKVPDFHDDPGYLDAQAALLRDTLDQAGPDPCVVFSAHSLPLKLIQQGDPYQRQVEATVAGVAARAGIEDWHLGWQSRSGPVKWLEPDVKQLLSGLIQQGRRALVLVAVSFVSDHIETLHEIDIRLRRHCLELGAESFTRCPVFNDDPRFITTLKEIVLRACQETHHTE